MDSPTSSPAPHLAPASSSPPPPLGPQLTPASSSPPTPRRRGQVRGRALGLARGRATRPRGRDQSVPGSHGRDQSVLRRMPIRILVRRRGPICCPVGRETSSPAHHLYRPEPSSRADPMLTPTPEPATMLEPGNRRSARTWQLKNVKVADGGADGVFHRRRRQQRKRSGPRVPSLPAVRRGSRGLGWAASTPRICRPLSTSATNTTCQYPAHIAPENLVVLDTEGTKMAATILDEQLDRLAPQISEGMAYFVSRMSVEPLIGWQQLMFAGNHHHECRFTFVTYVIELRNMDEQSLPFFPHFLPCKQIFPFTLENDIYVDAIGMIMHVSPMTFENDFYHRRIPIIDVQLMDDNYDFVKIVVRDRLVRDNFASWVRSNNERTIVIVTMLRSRRDIDQSLHTTVFSRVHFAPDIAAARRMKQRINNELV